MKCKKEIKDKLRPLTEKDKINYYFRNETKKKKHTKILYHGQHSLTGCMYMIISFITLSHFFINFQTKIVVFIKHRDR